MDLHIICIMEGKLYTWDHKGGLLALPSQYDEKYRQSIREIQRKKDWKTTGTGAKFMGAQNLGGPDGNPEDIRSLIEGIAPVQPDKLIYALNAGDNTGLYLKNPEDPAEAEGFILRDTGKRIYEMDYDRQEKRIIASISEDRFTRNLCLFFEDKPDYRVLTEGDSLDRNPCFAKDDPAMVYYDSAGLAVNEYGQVNGISPRMVLGLHLATGEIEEVVVCPGFDCLKPASAPDGNLYYIKRPHVKPGPRKNTLQDMLLAPGRILSAIVSWLNFFTRRYTGESLKTGGVNPAKSKQKTEEEIFIEGNMVNVAKTLKENRGIGEKYPGIAPGSWQLVRRKPGGEEEVVKKGVLDYTLTDNGSVIFANGKHLVRLLPGGEESHLAPAGIVTGIKAYECES